MPVDIRISGADRIASSIERSAKKIVGAIQRRLATKEQPWLDLLKATIDHVVYDAYDPVTYQRNRNLIEAASSRISTNPNGASLELYNDSSKIDYQPRADGSIGPRGGSPPEQVPWEVETGEYPSVGHGWLGYSLPRPAYLMTADLIRPEAEALADEALREGLRNE